MGTLSASELFKQNKIQTSGRRKRGRVASLTKETSLAISGNFDGKDKTTKEGEAKEYKPDAENHEMADFGLEETKEIPEKQSSEAQNTPSKASSAQKQVIKQENNQLPLEVPQEVIKGYNKKIAHTQKILAKRQRAKENNSKKIEKAKQEIKSTISDDLEIQVLVDHLSPQAKKFLSEILSQLKQSSENEDLYENFFQNKKMPELFSVNRQVLKNLLSNLAQSDFIRVLNINPYRRSKPSKIYRIIQCDRTLKEKIERYL